MRIRNFRGVQSADIRLDGHTLLVGGNSVGKSTICDALDLALGPERMFRRPVVDEYDFHSAAYLPSDEGARPEIHIEVVLVDLSDTATLRFGAHLRKWDVESNDFADVEADAIDEADTRPWCLPIVFFGRFNPAEDDFEGGTFFAHPVPISDDLTAEIADLGGGRRSFTREDKRYSGYLYLRPNRTGSRALSLQRGSLLDTIIRLESDTEVTLWEKLRSDLADVALVAKDSKLEKILGQVKSRVSQFVSLGGASDDVQLHASELTRENIREVLRVFISNKPGAFAVPFGRLSTGSLNLVVFALLTYIAELRGDTSVIFAMEEPEIAIPPHAQRRLVDFVTTHMGQAIVTSHSPYVIERFEPENIVVLRRDDDGLLGSGPITLPVDFKLKRYRENRRQFAEAILARAVLVVEGATEASLIPVAADVMEADPALKYTHIDLAGVSVFDAGNDVSVPLYAPLFRSLGKPVYGMHDTPSQPLKADIAAKGQDFTEYKVIPYSGVEDLLITEMPASTKRRFLEKAPERPDYPSDCGSLAPSASDQDVDALLRDVLRHRKGAYYGYAAALVAEAEGATELPASIVSLLGLIDQQLTAEPASPAVDHASDPGEGS
ncbi:putative ATP-dependent endonuclease of OLD family [Kribbella aluminosa]|uniref:ATP-dependent endonuclease of OLD family n=1 Tax=Kribbella aluminosa TaxID=416017 RepID=A0ABS4UTE2_9ACTN|nr:putative ATP-dependent endonuclease of OLD family [Kribbella aluminosa]